MRPYYLLYLITILAWSNLIRAQTSAAPVLYDSAGKQYFQHFDGLPKTGSFSLSGKGPFNLSDNPINANSISGWQILLAAGSNTNAGFAVSTGSSTGNGVYSLGATGSDERALGTLASGTGIYAIGLLLTNASGQPLNSFQFSFTAEQWRKGGSTNTNHWTFHYQTGSMLTIDQPELISEPTGNFSSAISSSSGSSLNGNLDVNRQTVNCTVTNILWKPGEQLLLRWDDADEPGSDDIVAIDDFRFSASLSSSKPEISHFAATNIGSTQVTVSADVNDHFSGTAVAVEYDTGANFSHKKNNTPSPDTVKEGSGTVTIHTTITGLEPGTDYFVRMIAKNRFGADSSSVLQLTTPITLPLTATVVVSALTSTAILGSNLISAGGGTIIERGIRWSADSTNLNNNISMGSGIGYLEKQITGLPQGKKIFACAFATNAGGTAFGDTVSFFTQTTIISLEPVSNKKTNADFVSFLLQTAQPVMDFRKSNFQVTGITDASIESVSNEGGTDVTIRVATGTGSGQIGLVFSNDTGLSVPVYNKPFAAKNNISIDKSIPEITAVLIRDTTMKVNDTIPILITVKPDKDVYQLSEGSIDDFVMMDFQKLSDSSYTAYFIIKNGGTDIDAASDIPLTLQLADAVGNTAIYQRPVSQPSDRIDANFPVITAIQNPSNGIYKTGDTLVFCITFNEKVFVSLTDIPSLPVTIGTRSKPATYRDGSGSNQLRFSYTIQPGDKDADGIKTGTAITLNNATISDAAGNHAITGFKNAIAPGSILVDAVSPEITAVIPPAAGTCQPGDSLRFSVYFSKPVFINTGRQEPFLNLIIGSEKRIAGYHNGSGTDMLQFSYCVQKNDMDTDGFRIVSPLADSAHALSDSLGNIATPGLHAIGSTKEIIINPPTIAILNWQIPQPGLYKTGDSLIFILLYNEPAWVVANSGSPSLKIVIGATTRSAIYLKGSGTPLLQFAYTIQPGDEDQSGIRLNSSLTLTNSSIKDDRGNNAPVSVAISGNETGIRVDAVPPAVSDIIVPANRIYKQDDSLECALVFTEPVFIAGLHDPPYLKLTIGSAEKRMMYAAGSGTRTIKFRYIVQTGDLDKNGIKLTSPVISGNGTMTDKAGNDIIPTYKINASLANILIDGIAPVFYSVKTDTIQHCENGPAINIADPFAVSDEEAGELVSWKIKNKPQLGTISLTGFSAISNGKKIIPAGIQYQPYENKQGTDSLVTEVTDGIYSIEKKIIINLHPAIRNNTIRSSQNICIEQIPFRVTGSVPEGGNGSYRFQWESASSADSVQFSIADNPSGEQHYTPQKLKSTAFFRRKVFSGTCTDSSNTIKITIYTAGFWTGKTNNNWNNAVNWCLSEIPVDTTDAFIFTGSLFNPTIAGNAACRNLVIADSAALQITGTLVLNGNISAPDHSISSGNGSIVLNGAESQSIAGNLFVNNSIQNLMINNNAGVTIKDSMLIMGRLLLNAGMLKTNNLITLGTDATVGASTNSSFIDGELSVRHLIKAGKKAYRLLGNPLAETISLQMIRDSLDITGEQGAINGFTPSLTNSASAFMFDPASGTDSLGFNNGWKAFTNTNGTNNNYWKRYEGIRLLFRGKPGQGLNDSLPPNPDYIPETVTLKLNGKINTGDQNIVFPPASDASYHVLANPYISNINMNRITRNAGISYSYWLWNPLQGKSGGYTSYLFNNRSILPVMGAFIIRTNRDSQGDLLFTENSKATETAADTTPAIHLDDADFMELRIYRDTVFWDRLVIVKTDSARTGFDIDDAEKIFNPDLSFYSIGRDGKPLSIDQRPITNGSVIPIGIQTTEKGEFRLCITGIKMPESNQLMLHDQWLEKWIPLEQDSVYAFNITDDTASFGNTRFEISSRPAKKAVNNTHSGISLRLHPVPVTDQLIIHYAMEQPGNCSVRVLSLTGTALKELSLGTQKDGQIMIPVSGLLPGIYLLEFRSDEKIQTAKFIKE